MLVAASANLLEPHVLPVRPIPTRALETQAPTIWGRTLREATPVASMGHLRDLQAGNTSVHLPVLDVLLAERDVPPRNPRRLVPRPQKRRQHEVRDLQLSRRELPPRTYPPEQRFRRLRRTTFRLRLAHFSTLGTTNNPNAPPRPLAGLLHDCKVAQSRGT